jgi:prepilin-type N-terminal cleavage/methylation domain-containing protein
MKTAHKQRGFSIIELLQAVLIFGMVVAIVFSLFLQIRKSMEKRARRHALLQTTQKAQAGIRRSLQSASGWCWGRPEGICFVGADEDTHEVMWKRNDSMLYWDGQKYFTDGTRMPLCVLAYAPGPDSLDARTPAEWFEELDEDRDGTLRGAELKRARWLKVRMVSARDGQSFSLDGEIKLPVPLIDDNGYFEL